MARISSILGKGAAVLALLLPGLAAAQLVVHTARWQAVGGGEWCDATPQLAAVCNGFRHCHLGVDPTNLCGGDPAVGKLKVLDIAYSCDGVRQPSAGFQDGSLAVLRCERRNNKSPLLQVRSARWEVIGGGPSCDAMPQLTRACNGKEICQVYVDPRYVCGFDPAVGQLKRLDIQYSCNGRAQTPIGFPDGAQALLRCDGVHSQPQPQTPPPVVHHHAGARVQVLNARWEVIGGGAWCDATAQMSRACNGQGSCQVPVDPNYLCNGDPAVGKLKRLDVTYSCDGKVQPKMGFPDGSQATLRCAQGGTGSIGGNSSTGGVPVGPVRPNHIHVTAARWEVNNGGAWCDALPQMGEACDGKRVCQVLVDPRYLCNGDPAPGKYKTLSVQFNCNGRPQSAIGFPDGSQAVLRCD